MSMARTTRRAMLGGSAALLVSSVGLGAVVSGCAGPAGEAGGAAGAAAPPASPAPTPASTKVTLSFEPLNAGLWSTQGSKIVHDALWDTLRPWREAHPGVDLQMLPFGGDTDSTALIAGTAPDVILAWANFGSLGYGGFLHDLTPYVRASNRDLTVFPSYTVNGYKIEGRLYALPFYVATTSMVVDYTALDELGLPYPDPNAPIGDWANLWRATTRKGTHPRVGGTLKSTEVGLPQSYFQGWGAAILDPADVTRCTLDAPAALDAGNALFPLLQEGICTLEFGIDGPWHGIPGGRYASAVLWNAALAITDLVATLARLQKWDFHLMPSMPKGNFAHAEYDYRAINAQSKQPDLAWELLDWLSFEPDFQRTLMKFGLEPPALKSLQEEYTQILKQIVPPFQTKNLSVLGHYIVSDTAVMDPIFEANESQIQAALTNTESAIATRKVSVELGMRQLSQQVDALIQGGLSEKIKIAEMQKQFPAKGPTVAPVPAGV